jgi:signal transduction histidine kinase
VKSNDKMTEVKIIDFGLGIAKKEEKAIFLTFQRGENVDTIQGTGLGLSIVNDAIKRHNGSLNLESVVNKGTTFTIQIPKK